MKKTIRLLLNHKIIEITAPKATPLLDVLRNQLNVFGSKEGCREGECGACTVIMGRFENHRVLYKAVPACLLPIAEVSGRHIITIEGLEEIAPTPFQQAFVDQGASQCGFCTPGFILSLTASLFSESPVSQEAAFTSIDGNICRCTGYSSIRRAIKQVFATQHMEGKILSTEELVERKFLPRFILQSHKTLQELQKTSNEKVETIDMENLVLAGGTDLYIQQSETIEKKNVSIISPDWFTETKLVNQQIEIPANMCIETLRTDKIMNKNFPGFSEKLKLFASTIVRNRATVAGNIVNASPIGDMSIVLLAMEGMVHFNTGRSILLDHLFLDYKKLDMKEGELIANITVPVPEAHAKWNFVKVSKRKHLDIASVTSAFSASVSSGIFRKVRLSMGGVAPVPLLCRKTADFLEGTSTEEVVPEKAAAILASEMTPISDVRGNAHYKRLLSAKILQAHLESTKEEKAYA